MDRTAHTRFLTYIETWDYFREPGEKRLGREAWLAFDTELEALLALSKERQLDAEEAQRAAKLARALMRD